MHERQPTEERVPDHLVPIDGRPRLDPAPRLFAPSELDYRAGRLHGRWIGMARSSEEVQADLNLMLSRSPTARARGQRAERWISLASEGFGPTPVDERLGVSRLTELARTLRTEQLAFAAWASLDPTGSRGHLQRFNDVYLGYYDSLLEYVGIELDAGRYEQKIEAVVPAELRPYVSIDVGLLARDIASSGEIRTVPVRESGGVFLFRGELDEPAAENVVESANNAYLSKGKSIK